MSTSSELNQIAQFFGVDSSGSQMQHLTGATRSELERAAAGEAPARAAHIANLAAFCVELAGAMRDMTGRDMPLHGSMEQWLHDGAVATRSAGVCRPWDALADPDLAAEALSELRRAAG